MFSVVNSWSASGNNVAYTLPLSGVTAGNVLVFIHSCLDGRASVNPVFTDSAAWTKLASYNSGSDTRPHYVMYYKVADGTEGSITVNDDTSVGSWNRGSIYELSGLGAAPLDAYGSNSIAGAGTLTINLTATGPGVAFALAHDGKYSDNVTTWSGYSGFTDLVNQVSSYEYGRNYAYMEYGSAGTVTASGTISGGRLAGAMALFLAASGGGTSIAVTDTGSGADTLGGIAVSLSMADSGVGVDAMPGAAASVQLSDAGTGADALTMAALLAVSDTGAGAEAINLAIAIQVADAGAGADLVNLLTATLIQILDTGAGADVVGALSVSLGVADTGAGADATVIQAALQLADAGTGVDALSVLTATLIQILDTGAGADALSVAVAVPVSDAGLGTDLLAIQAVIALVETATGADAVLRFDSAQRIYTITITLAQRRAEFSFRQRQAVFTLN